MVLTTSAYLWYRAVTSKTWLRRLLTIWSLVVFLISFFFRWWLMMLRWCGVGNRGTKCFVDFFWCNFDIVQLYQLWQRTKNDFSIANKIIFWIWMETSTNKSYCGPAESTQGFSSNQRYFSFVRFCIGNFYFVQFFVIKLTLTKSKASKIVLRLMKNSFDPQKSVATMNFCFIFRSYRNKWTEENVENATEAWKSACWPSS